MRTELVARSTALAAQFGFAGMDFLPMEVAQSENAAGLPSPIHIVTALHACDTATDLAIAAGIREGASVIVVAPCCHKQIRKAMHTRNELAPVLRHGILEERQAEILTDGIRALLLEAEGYRTAVFEFISTEHTAKNVMITAIRAVDGGRQTEEKRRSEALGKVAALKAGFGIEEHFLERLL